MPSPPPHPSVYSQQEEQINNAHSSASDENRHRLPGSPARTEATHKPGFDPTLDATNKVVSPAKPINSSASPSQTKIPKPQAASPRQHNAGASIKSEYAETSQSSKSVKPYPAEQGASNSRINQQSSQKKNPPLALQKLENSEKSSLSARQLEKNSYKEKSILSIDNKKVLKLKFEWPLNGRITRNFVQTDNKGIDISGKMGQAVRAAEAGKAVYCGHGLTGFGNLAVIKHNETYLSAYANASRLFIKEGQRISKGQAIGEIGDSGFKRALLHFEIRKNGKSINPLTVLPKL